MGCHNPVRLVTPAGKATWLISLDEDFDPNPREPATEGRPLELRWTLLGKLTAMIGTDELGIPLPITKVSYKLKDRHEVTIEVRDGFIIWQINAQPANFRAVEYELNPPCDFRNIDLPEWDGDGLPPQIFGELDGEVYATDSTGNAFKVISVLIIPDEGFNRQLSSAAPSG